MTADILAALVRINLVAAAAILLVLALRPLVLSRLGARTAYRLWLIVPVAAAACLLPARQVAFTPPPTFAASEDVPVLVEETAPAASAAPTVAARPPVAAPPALSDALLVVWLLVAAGLLARSIAGTRRTATDAFAGPGLVGVFKPRLVLPTDFEARFDERERALILAHEETHRMLGHPLINGLIEAARCACWFNPLAHLAAHRIRTDQELACDAAVIAAHPGERRTYAEALLKTQLAPAFLPLVCTWPSGSSANLKERITLLTHPSPGRRAGFVGAALILMLGGASGFAAWAQQPAQLALPEAVWTHSAEAPEGMLTPREVTLHDQFIELAQAGDIDIVFFGRTNTEMFRWPDRGRPVWDRTLGLRKAANFGSQGTNPQSLLWRMQNGELDGFRAKIVVLEAFGAPAPQTAESADSRDELIAAYTPIIAELRARQPQAKILIMATFPRGQLSLERWRLLAGENAAAHTDLVDHETVFYLDISERFFLPDGAHNQAMWRYPPLSGMSNVGIQAPGFEAWAEELEPWLDRFAG